MTKVMFQMQLRTLNSLQSRKNGSQRAQSAFYVIFYFHQQNQDCRFIIGALASQSCIFSEILTSVMNLDTTLGQIMKFSIGAQQFK